mmetsp:Transcript_12059/g.29208  ORF Transcript_12059/g.29208 Transcript_12059/m.29208 type:complete len:222 (-) Transcript_12059:564-1229(-)
MHDRVLAKQNQHRQQRSLTFGYEVVARLVVLKKLQEVIEHLARVFVALLQGESVRIVAVLARSSLELADSVVFHVLHTLKQTFDLVRHHCSVVGKAVLLSVLEEAFDGKLQVVGFAQKPTDGGETAGAPAAKRVPAACEDHRVQADCSWASAALRKESCRLRWQQHAVFFCRLHAPQLQLHCFLFRRETDLPFNVVDVPAKPPHMPLPQFLQPPLNLLLCR